MIVLKAASAADPRSSFDPSPMCSPCEEGRITGNESYGSHITLEFSELQSWNSPYFSRLCGTAEEVRCHTHHYGLRAGWGRRADAVHKRESAGNWGYRVRWDSTCCSSRISGCSGLQSLRGGNRPGNVGRRKRGGFVRTPEDCIRLRAVVLGVEFR